MITRLVAALSGIGKSDDPGELLKEATQHRAKAEFESAVRSLRAAYSAIANGPTIYPIETFLRLPLYLQQAGKADEAWSEFNKLLVDGYPNQMKDRSVVLMEQSRIYDKMRLFLQREGKRTYAVPFGIASYLSWAVGLRLQERNDELEARCSTEAISEVVAKLLKKAGRETKQAELVSLVQNQMADLDRINLANVVRNVQAILA